MTNPRADPLPQISWIGNNGFDFVDLAVEPPSADLQDLDVHALQSALNYHKLGVIVHSSPHLPFDNPHPAAQAVARSELLRTLELAHELGAPLLTTHYLGAPTYFNFEQIRDHYVKLLGEICLAAAGTSVAVALENSPINQSEVLLFREILRRVPAARFLLDVGHANLNSNVNLTRDFLWDQDVGARLAHVHVSDNDGRRDLHLPLGSVRSAIDWPQVVRLLRKAAYDGTITLEVFSPERDYLLASRDKFRAWWQDTA